MANPRAFLTISRQEAGYRPVEDRIGDFSEVEQTLNSSDRRRQASRCMDCGVPFCHWACPIGNKQPEWQDFLYKGQWKEAFHVLEQTCDFPEFTGRVCPALCEKSCVLKLSCDEPVTIRENEVAIVEAAFREGFIQPVQPVRNGKRVAVIGSGPAGLTVANQLNRKGYEVTVFEKDELPGGLLRFGIPNFKLGKKYHRPPYPADGERRYPVPCQYNGRKGNTDKRHSRRVRCRLRSHWCRDTARPADRRP